MLILTFGFVLEQEEGGIEGGKREKKRGEGGAKVRGDNGRVMQAFSFLLAWLWCRGFRDLVHGLGC